MAARLALMSNGWVVATTDTDESYDIVARDPASGDWRTIQVKTVRVRDDRSGELVVYARRTGGRRYLPEDAEYIIGVQWQDSGLPRVWLFENRGLAEYWATDQTAAERWIELPINAPDDITEPHDVTAGPASELAA